jgi:hypothetical protein
VSRGAAKLALMCSSPEFVASLAFIGLLACMALGLVHERRFVAYVKKHHLAVWSDLGKRSKWLMPEDGNYSYAGVQWYLILCGGYKEIDDPRARELGRNARLVSMVAFACFVVIALYATIAQNFPSPHCLVPWQ